MKRFIFFAVAFVVILNSCVQNTKQEDKEQPQEYVIVDGAKIYNEDFVDTKAEFKGGEEALMKYLDENINYPLIAMNISLQGKVYVKFIVRTTGEISNVELMRKVHYSLDTEAIRLVINMPKWNPAIKDGKAVSSFCVLPITWGNLK